MVLYGLEQELPEQLEWTIAAPSIEEARARVEQVRIVASTMDGRVPTRPIRIELFGGCTVLRDGSPIPSDAWQGRRQARIVLARLIAARGGWVERDRLAEGLWSDASPSEVGGRLPPILNAVRGALGDDGSRCDDESRLRIHGSAVSVQLAAGDSCDLLEFFDLVDRARVARSPGRAASLAVMALTAPIDAVLLGLGESRLVDEVRGMVIDEASSILAKVSHDLDGPSAERLLARARWLHGLQPEDERMAASTMRIAASAGDAQVVESTFRQLRRALASDARVPSETIEALRRTSLARAAA
jgi:DNA-binding SARP family transcriptional activator